MCLPAVVVDVACFQSSVVLCPSHSSRPVALEFLAFPPIYPGAVGDVTSGVRLGLVNVRQPNGLFSRPHLTVDPCMDFGENSNSLRSSIDIDATKAIPATHRDRSRKEAAGAPCTVGRLLNLLFMG